MCFDVVGKHIGEICRGGMSVHAGYRGSMWCCPEGAGVVEGCTLNQSLDTCAVGHVHVCGCFVILSSPPIILRNGHSNIKSIGRSVDTVGYLVAGVEM